MLTVRTIGAVVGLSLAACGGGGARPAAPVESAADDSGGGPDTSAVLIPYEKYDEIKSVFERKTAIVGRCYVAGIEAGQIDKAAKGFVTVGVTVTTDGKASKVRVLKSSFKSSALEGCMIEMVGGWEFTDSLPKPLDTSHTYVLDRL
jgi:hypothetical protein